MTSEPWGGKTQWLFLRLCHKAEKKGVEKVHLALHQLESSALVTPPCDVPGPDTVRVRQDGPLCNGHVLSKYSRHTAHYFILNMFLKAYIWFSTWSVAWDGHVLRCFCTWRIQCRTCMLGMTYNRLYIISWLCWRWMVKVSGDSSPIRAVILLIFLTSQLISCSKLVGWCTHTYPEHSITIFCQWR